MVVLRNQKSESKEVAAIEFAAVTMESWLSTELLSNLVWSDGEQTRVDSIAIAAANNGFLRRFL